MTTSAILLTGGQSRRMGVDKATVLIAGQPLWQRQLQILGELGPQTLRVSARTVPFWCPPEIEVMLDRPPSRGPLSGVAEGLRGLRTSHLLVLAVDLPRMTTAHLRKLCRMAQPGLGLIPWQGGHFEPLCAIYPAEAVSLAENALSRGWKSLQHLAQNLVWQSRARIYELTREEQSLYINMNTPFDLPAAGGLEAFRQPIDIQAGQKRSFRVVADSSHVSVHRQ
jgi:molybdopterin-guanine dinucleotide biosynthesis protein A